MSYIILNYLVTAEGPLNAPSFVPYGARRRRGGAAGPTVRQIHLSSFADGGIA
jgi:hypothetical protein